MTLRTRLIFAAAVAVVAIFGISEMLAQRQAVAFFHEHERRLAQGGDHDVHLSALQNEKRALVWELAVLRFVSGGLTIAVLSFFLAVLWRRMVSRPISLLLDKMNKMGRGTWDQPIPVEQDDEIGRVLREFNVLGPRLSFVAQQYASASKLAAMALIGQRVIRRMNEAQRQLRAVYQSLRDSGADTTAIQIRNIADDLQTIGREFDSEFEAELKAEVERQRQSTATGVPQPENRHASIPEVSETH
jgi:nitrate/nitrite-specific signal transduction histidine kinase